MFEDRSQLLVFCLYVLTGVASSQLITWSQSDGKMDYPPEVVVLIAETIKCSIAAMVYIRSNSLASFIQLLFSEKRLFFLYSIPSGLYAAFNILSFYSYLLSDPTSYIILLQLRTVVTPIIYQIIFNRRLSLMQWISIGVLVTGTLTKQVNFEKGFAIEMNSAVPIIMVQIFCSCFAGVYNEYLLKSKDANFWVQNTFFYLNSIIINAVVFLCRPNSSSKSIASEHLFPLLLVACNMAAMGLITAMFLKKLNSVLKMYASAAQLLFTAISSAIFFAIAINGQTILALIFIFISMWLYAKNPIQTQQKTQKYEKLENEDDLEDGEKIDQIKV